MNKATITIELEGVEMLQAKRCEILIRELFQAGVFGIRNGKAVLYFDGDGMLGRVDAEIVKWNRRNNGAQSELENFYKSAIIGTSSLPQDKERAN